ncbi:FtsX [Streptococcus thermophilus CNCM I-1630]|nr:FtsX [Streptococcus thermophilus CNCM I-1630]
MNPDSTDASETVKDFSGQIVANKDYHKIYNALTKIKGVDKVTFSSKEEQKETTH